MMVVWVIDTYDGGRVLTIIEKTLGLLDVIIQFYSCYFLFFNGCCSLSVPHLLLVSTPTFFYEGLDLQVVRAGTS